jgi:Holliday junction resolvase
MSNFQKKIIEQYKRNGYTVIKLAKTNFNGIADLLAGNGVDTVLIECKEKKDTIKKLQVFQNERLSKAFGWRFIILQDGIGEVDYSEAFKPSLDF